MTSTEEISPNYGTPVDKLIGAIGTAVYQWQQEQANKIGAEVRATLDTKRDEVLMMLLGFDKHSLSRGNWSIDHCNGRSGQSVAGVFFAEAQTKAINEWLAEVPIPTMTPEFKSRITKELKKAYENRISSSVYEMARQAAANDLKALVEEFLKPVRVEAFLKMQSLIDPSTPDPSSN